jgi:hypothetical protein
MKVKLHEGLLISLLCAPLGAIAQDGAAPAATAQATEASSATGTVVFFREKKFAGAAISYKVRENGIELCKLKSGTFCTVQVPVGKHSYEVHSEAKDVLTLEVESGETYYVLGAMSVGVFAGRPNLSPSTKAAYDAAKEKMKDNTGQDLDPPKEPKEKKHS